MQHKAEQEKSDALVAMNHAQDAKAKADLEKQQAVQAKEKAEQ